MEENLIYYLAAIPVLGLIAQLLAWWTRLPSILLLLGFGALLGLLVDPEQWVREVGSTPQAAEQAEPGVGDNSIISMILFPLVSLSVAVILFEGGLSLRFNELRTAGRAVLRLVTVGALVSWMLTLLVARWVLSMPWETATLIGAILVVTGPTVVVPMMRYIRPNRRIGSIVKWEGIVIDPIGAVLAVLVFENFFLAATSDGPAYGPVITLVLTALIGVGIGLLMTAVLVLMVKRFWIPDYLHGVSFLSSAIAAYACSNLLMPESGLVTVTVMGILLANQKFVSIDHVIQFKENLGVFLISCLFIVLGSRLNLGDLWDLGVAGVIFLVLLIVLVRPVSVILAMLRTKTTWQERVFLSCLAPRGIVAAAVTSVFALKIASLAGSDPQLAGFAESARQLVPVTFLVIVGTVTIYGLGAAPLARRLKLSDVDPQGLLIAGADDWIRDIARAVKKQGFAVVLVDTNYRNVAAAKMEGLAAYCVSILSDHIYEEADLSGIGRMLALTSNDEVNALASKEYAHVFGRKNVFQLPPNDTGTGRRTSLAQHQRGRELFGKRWSEEQFWACYRGGYRVKSTNLTKEFTFADFQKIYGQNATVLMTVDQNRSLRISTADQPLEPKTGRTLIAFVLEQPNGGPSPPKS